MKTKFKSVFTGLFYVLITAAFIGLAVYNFILTVDMKGYLAVLTFVVGAISMAVGVGLSYMDGMVLLDNIFNKKKTKEAKDRGKEQ